MRHHGNFRALYSEAMWQIDASVKFASGERNEACDMER
jgi:hypothetical protein